MDKENIATAVLIGGMSIGWFYYIYLCVVIKSYAWLIAGIFVPIVSAPVGLYALFFGAPGWLMSN